MDDKRIALVTGATRGAGKGIALALGEAGYVVFVTGRSDGAAVHELGGSVGQTAALVTARGGLGIPLVCDHAHDEQVREAFDAVRERYGRLDLLVNNAFAVPEELVDRGPFWTKSLDLLQMIEVGLRSTYVASWYAAPLLLAGEAGLVVNTSGFGGGCYLHGPACGAVKAGVDKMAHDMAVDLEPHGVTAVSLWMGLLRTERTARTLGADPGLYAESRPIMLARRTSWRAPGRSCRGGARSRAGSARRRRSRARLAALVPRWAAVLPRRRHPLNGDGKVPGRCHCVTVHPPSTGRKTPLT